MPKRTLAPPDDPKAGPMLSGDEPEGRVEEVLKRVPDSGEVEPREIERPKTVEPRLERYRER